MVLASLLVALVMGFCVSLGTTAYFTQVTYRYEPPLTPPEVQKLSELPPGQAGAILASRRVPYSKRQWLADALRETYFWKELLKRSVIPAMAIFLSCILVAMKFRRITSTTPPA